MSPPVVKPWIYVIAPGRMVSLNASGRSIWSDKTVEEDTLVFAFDVDAYESIAEAAVAVVVYWERVKHLDVTPILIAAVGHKVGGNMNPITGVVQGVVQRPDGDTFEVWNAALQPLLIGLKHLDYEDSLDPSETQGGVSREEFAETLRRTARGDD